MVGTGGTSGRLTGSHVRCPVARTAHAQSKSRRGTGSCVEATVWGRPSGGIAAGWRRPRVSGSISRSGVHREWMHGIERFS